MRTDTDNVADIHCGGCEATIRTLIGDVEGIQVVKPDHLTNQVIVSYDETFSMTRRSVRLLPIAASPQNENRRSVRPGTVTPKASDFIFPSGQGRSGHTYIDREKSRSGTRERIPIGLPDREVHSEQGLLVPHSGSKCNAGGPIE